MMRFDWYSFIGGLLGGGFLLKFCELSIIWVREKREQRSQKSSQEKDRPRFRIDAPILPTNHPDIKTVIVKILSLGSLPVTINYGDVAIYSSKYPEPIAHDKTTRKEVTPLFPIEIPLTVKQGLIHPTGSGEVEIKLVCKLSYGNNGEGRNEEQYYNRQSRKFESR